MSYLYLPGVAGQSASTPDHDRLDFAGDFDIRVKVAMDDWTPSVVQYLYGKSPGSGLTGYSFRVDATGKLAIIVGDGTMRTGTSTVATGLTDGATKWVRVAFDSVTPDVTFYTSDDGVTWAQLGDVAAITYTGPTSTNTVVPHIGAFGGGIANHAAGGIYRVQLYSDISETTLVLDANFENLTQAEVEAGSFTEDANSAVVTLNGDEWAYVEPHTGGILGRAELLLMAGDKYAKGSPKWPDKSGNNHHAQHGSAAGADTNDPLGFVGSDFVGLQYLHLPGIAANYASAPDSAALDITGDIDVRVRVALTDWTPVAQSTLVAKWAGGGGTLSWLLSVKTDGALQLRWTEDGTAQIISTSTVATGVTDGVAKWIRFTMDVDNGAAGNDVEFFTSDDNVTWVQLGTTVTTAGTTSFHSGSSIVEIGSNATGGTWPADAKFYRAQIYNGIDGTAVFDADFTNAAALTEPFATFVEDSSNGATVTINRAASGRVSTVVDKAMFLLGTDDYFEIPDHANLDFANGEDLTLMVAARVHDTGVGAFDTLVAKTTAIGSTAAGYALAVLSDAIHFYVQDGTAFPSDVSATVADHVAFVASGVRNTGDDDIEAFIDGTGTGSPTTDSTTVTLANAEVLRIGRQSGAGVRYLDSGEIFAVALWREALSDADVAAAGVELTVSNAGAMMLLGVGA